MASSNKLKLYSYWKSSSSARIRIALSLKGIEYQYMPVNLQEGSNLVMGWNLSSLVPVVTCPFLTVVSDSFAIMLYLEEKHPQRHPLLPRDLPKKAINYQAAIIVCSSIQPSHNKNLLYKEEKLGAHEKQSWAKWHIEKGFAALERLLKDHAGRYAAGDEIFMADLFLATQIDYAIKNFKVDMAQFPLLSRLNEYYVDKPDFKDAMPEKQPDTPSATN